MGVVAGCGGGTGSVKMSLTDAPPAIANLKSVNVTIAEVRVHDDASTDSADGGSAGSDGDGADGAGWIVLCTETQTLDLLTLSGGKLAPLCGGKAIEVPAGNVSQVRLGVISAQLIFNDGTTSNLTVPSGGQSGLKVDVNQAVPKGGTLEVKLDFVANESIVLKGNGTYSLKPVLRVVK